MMPELRELYHAYRHPVKFIVHTNFQTYRANASLRQPECELASHAVGWDRPQDLTVRPTFALPVTQSTRAFDVVCACLECTTWCRIRLGVLFLAMQIVLRCANERVQLLGRARASAKNAMWPTTMSRCVGIEVALGRC